MDLWETRIPPSSEADEGAVKPVLRCKAHAMNRAIIHMYGLMCRIGCVIEIILMPRLGNAVGCGPSSGRSKSNATMTTICRRPKQVT
mmetsp:Transcript_13999/g.30033  ORF Transcript_13999/g.30033 Transcript_13999/m.30033 type:complete len:87 (+) Transcript_13999:1300-1560(+)